MSRIAQEGAIAALGDQDHLASVVRDVAAARDQITKIASANGLTSIPSATNFVTIDCGKDGEFARAVLKELIDRDIFVRMPGVAPLDRCIRVGAGRKTDLEAFAAALPDAIAAAAG